VQVARKPLTALRAEQATETHSHQQPLISRADSAWLLSRSCGRRCAASSHRWPARIPWPQAEEGRRELRKQAGQKCSLVEGHEDQHPQHEPSNSLVCARKPCMISLLASPTTEESANTQKATPWTNHATSLGQARCKGVLSIFASVLGQGQHVSPRCMLFGIMTEEKKIAPRTKRGECP